jgi:hypothetical protein
MYYLDQYGSNSAYYIRDDQPLVSKFEGPANAPEGD